MPLLLPRGTPGSGLRQQRSERSARAGEAPQAPIEIDRDRAARYGLNSGDIERVIEIGLAGKAATELFDRFRPWVFQSVDD